MPLEPARSGPHEGLRVAHELLDRKAKLAASVGEALALNLAPVLTSIVCEYARPRVWDIELETPHLPELSFFYRNCGKHNFFGQHCSSTSFEGLKLRMPHATGFRWFVIGKEEGIWCRTEARQVVDGSVHTDHLWLPLSHTDEDRVLKDLLGIERAGGGRVG
jgi:hypothetical protein